MCENAADLNGQAISKRTSRSSGAVSIGRINYERIWNGESVPREFFCPICSCLWWQPHSCGSCQNLFYEACILKWTQMNRSCRYGCEQYEDRRCSPQIQCLLSNIWIRCQSSQYGCTAVLSYDKLDMHQINQCPYPLARCQYCERLMLVNAIEVHDFPLYLLKEHQSSCALVSIQNYLQTMNGLQNKIQPVNTYLPTISTQNAAIQFGNIFTVTSEEQEIRDHYYNLSWWHRIWSFVCLIFMKPSDTPQNLRIMRVAGLSFMLGEFLALTLNIFSYFFLEHMYRLSFYGCFTGILHSSIPWFLNLVDDISIMVYSTILFLVVGASIIYTTAHRLNKGHKLRYVLLEYIVTIFYGKLPGYLSVFIFVGYLPM
ncbi:unnamed protein product [Rotaria socialis]|uniref:Uncharacterized protein n=1 Tax=Rotaria socialis TaxID=392032 RepID=A0A818D1M6_9BILA|nr:unnamed protein product [Rotaria socialis]